MVRNPYITFIMYVCSFQYVSVAWDIYDFFQKKCYPRVAIQPISKRKPENDKVRIDITEETDLVILESLITYLLVTASI